jgi:DNA helicase HerA-like ATPase
MAASIDGRSFSFHASLDDLQFRVGSYVVVTDGEHRWLGQVLTLELGLVEVRSEPAGSASDIRPAHKVAAALGSGLILAESRPFHRATVQPASAAEVTEWQTANRPGRALEVGEFADLTGVPARLDAAGFDRHTFLCGQSGSGKTYSLGVVLEQLLMETDLRMVVLDPNSDFVRLGQVRKASNSQHADRSRAIAAHIEVLRARSLDGQPLCLRGSELNPECRAALLQLDPVTDREEYAALAELLEHDEAGRPLISGRPETPVTAWTVIVIPSK